MGVYWLVGRLSGLLSNPKLGFLLPLFSGSQATISTANGIFFLFSFGKATSVFVLPLEEKGRLPFVSEHLLSRDSELVSRYFPAFFSRHVFSNVAFRTRHAIMGWRRNGRERNAVGLDRVCTVGYVT